MADTDTPHTQDPSDNRSEEYVVVPTHNPETPAETTGEERRARLVVETIELENSDNEDIDEDIMGDDDAEAFLKGYPDDTEVRRRHGRS